MAGLTVTERDRGLRVDAFQRFRGRAVERREPDLGGTEYLLALKASVGAYGVLGLERRLTGEQPTSWRGAANFGL